MWDEYKESPKMQETNDNTFNRNEIFVAFQIYFGQEIDDYDKIFTHLFELVSDKTHVFKVFSFINYICSKENSSELVNFDALNAIFNISTCSEYHFKYVLGTIQILDSQQNFEYLSSIDYQIFLTTIDKYHNSHEILHLSLHYLDKCISHLKTVDIYTTVLDFFQFFNQTYQFYFELPEFCIITKIFNSIIDDYDGYDYSVCFSSSGLFYEYLFNDE